MKVMDNWQNLATYNKIGTYQFTVTGKRMSAEEIKIEHLDTLDPQALTIIHNRYYPEIYRFVRFRVGDAATAEDITADVFMRLLVAIHRGRGPNSNLRGWLFRTTSNVVNDHYRDIYNHPKDESAEILEQKKDLYLPQSDPGTLMEQTERSRQLQKALDQLTDPQKLVITLRFGNRFSLEQTSKLMGKNVNSVKALQFRALEALRKKLGNGRL
jgi:RNA polymerase sigma-70 factor (ECF subfamily)